MKQLVTKMATRFAIWQIDAVGAGTIALAALLWYTFGLQPLSEARAERRMLEERLQEQRTIADKTRKSMLQSESDVKKLKADIASSEVKLQPVSAINQRVQSITMLASKHKLRVDEIKPREPEAQQRFTVVPIRVGGQGGFRSVTNFLQALRKEYMDTGVVGLQIRSKPQGESSDLQYQFDLVWYAAPSAGGDKKK